MTENWKSFFSNKKNLSNFFATLIILFTVLSILPKFLEFVEKRDGFAFTDPLLSLFNPIDLTWVTFSLIYLGLIAALIHLNQFPKYFVLALKVYAITGIFRIIAMYLLPLNPPSTMIILNDPFVQLFGSGEILTKDLFFSGHTSTLFILFLTAQTKVWKWIFLISTIAVAICVIAQHVHYSIDVFAAPFFAFAAFKTAEWIELKFHW